ncbi:MAG: hypothetical protein JHC33_13225, partial [Ignisphaera sp.]|nr:hypothetical protein [Ignisphaera sp.]
MSIKSHEAEIETWATVFGLSNKTVELAKQLLQRIVGAKKKVYSMSKPLLALYVASIISGEYIPLAYFSAQPRLVRHDLRKFFGIDLSLEKLVEIETRGLCRVLRLDRVLCEASVCTAVNTFNELKILKKRRYASLALVAIRLVARHMHRRVSLPRHLFFPRLNTAGKISRKYVEACIDKAKTVA